MQVKENTHKSLVPVCECMIACVFKFDGKYYMRLDHGSSLNHIRASLDNPSKTSLDNGELVPVVNIVRGDIELFPVKTRVELVDAKVTVE